MLYKDQCKCGGPGQIALFLQRIFCLSLVAKFILSHWQWEIATFSKYHVYFSLTKELCVVEVKSFIKLWFLWMVNTCLSTMIEALWPGRKTIDTSTVQQEQPWAGNCSIFTQRSLTPVDLWLFFAILFSFKQRFLWAFLAQFLVGKWAVLTQVCTIHNIVIIINFVLKLGSAYKLDCKADKKMAQSKAYFWKPSKTKQILILKSVPSLVKYL